MYTAERYFVRTAHEQMCVLETEWAAPMACMPALGEQPTLSALGMIKETALSVSARGIYRTASLCEDVLKRAGTEGAAKFRGSLAGLKCLIHQYADGLFEIDPNFKHLLLGEIQISKRVTEAPNAEISADETVDIKQAHDQAANVLQPLLHLAKTDKQKQALSRLMQKTKAKPNNVEGKQSFDALMRPITNLALSEARYSGKRVSISYVADFTELATPLAGHIKSILKSLYINIVDKGIGFERAQISLTGQMQADDIRVSINWQGHDMLREGRQNERLNGIINQLQSMGGTIKLHKPALGGPGKPNQPLLENQNIELLFPRQVRLGHMGVDKVVAAAGG